MTTAATAVWLSGELKVFELVALSTAIAASLLVVCFDWRETLLRRMLDELKSYRKGVGGVVFRNLATIEYRELALDNVLRVGTATEVRQAELEFEARQQRLAAERALDSVLADSFPASDPPSWTLGITRPQPERQAANDETVPADDSPVALVNQDVIDLSGPATNGGRS